MLTADLMADLIIGLYFLSALDSVGAGAAGPSPHRPTRTRAG
jgi:hypothetical protein